MKLVVFEDAGYVDLLPLVYSRATFNLRCGFDNLLDKIESAFGQAADALLVRASIAPAIAERQSRPVNVVPDGDDQLWINGGLLVRKPFALPQNTVALRGETLLAARLDAKLAGQLTAESMLDASMLEAALARCGQADLPADAARMIDYPWRLIHENEAEIVRQFQAVDRRMFGDVHPGAHLLNEAAIYIGASSRIKPTAVLDAEDGPIFIGKDVIVGPNVTITGPCFIGDRCRVQPGASIRAGSTIGMFCKVGGEVEGSIFHGYANKQHDGFLGHSYVGEWVNLGAGTVTSDLKNTYGPVSVPINGRLIDSGEMFVGTVFGDHTKTGIGVALPTGCIIGYASNIFLSAYPPKFVPSFSWLTDDATAVNDSARALAVAHRVVARRERTFSPVEDALFLSIADEARRHEHTA